MKGFHVEKCNFPQLYERLLLLAITNPKGPLLLSGACSLPGLSCHQRLLAFEHH